MSTESLDAKVAAATNHLALDLYKCLPQDQNAFFSPLSIATCFGMLYYGARDETAAEMRNVLGYDRADLPEQQVCKAFRQVLSKLLREQEKYTLDVANKALTTAKVPTLESYRSGLVEYFMAELEEVDFCQNGKAIMAAVNSWVSEKTKGKIGHILSKPPDPQTALILLNAVYFKGTWKSKFEEEKTEMKPFYSLGVTRKDVHMMHMDVDAMYSNCYKMNCLLLELPYLGEELAMVFILPYEKEGLPDLEKNLTAEKLQKALDKLHDAQDINVMLPRFKFEKQYDLKEVMQSAGLQKVFTHESNLGGISEAAPLYVSDAIHKAVIEVNEEGSEAAAVTAAYVMFMSSDSVPERDQRIFHADHPFIFLIREKPSGLTLFIGRVNEL